MSPLVVCRGTKTYSPEGWASQPRSSPFYGSDQVGSGDTRGTGHERAVVGEGVSPV